jgi:hypothetical protein
LQNHHGPAWHQLPVGNLVTGTLISAASPAFGRAVGVAAQLLQLFQRPGWQLQKKAGASACEAKLEVDRNMSNKIEVICFIKSPIAVLIVTAYTNRVLLYEK